MSSDYRSVKILSAFYLFSILKFSFTELTRKFYGIADNLSDTNAALSCIILVSVISYLFSISSKNHTFQVCLALATAFVTYKVARDPIWLGIGLVLLLISLAWLTGSIPDLVSCE